MTDEAKRIVEGLRWFVSYYPKWNGIDPCQTMTEAADLIEHLSSVAEKSSVKAALCETVMENYDKIRRERDAAVADMELLQGTICQACKEYYRPDPNVRHYSCKIYGNDWGELTDDGNLLACGKFKWRGLKEDNNNG